MSAVTLYYIQYGVTLAVLLLVPGLLWAVRRERFVTKDKNKDETSLPKNYKIAWTARMVIFDALLVLSAALFFVTDQVAFLYLAVIVFLATLFAVKK